MTYCFVACLQPLEFFATPNSPLDQKSYTMKIHLKTSSQHKSFQSFSANRCSFVNRNHNQHKWVPLLPPMEFPDTIKAQFVSRCTWGNVYCNEERNQLYDFQLRAHVNSYSERNWNIYNLILGMFGGQWQSIKALPFWSHCCRNLRFS